MDHGMTRVFATLFDKDTEMIQLAIECFGMVHQGPLLDLNDSTTHPMGWYAKDLCYILMIQQHIPFLVK